MTPRVEAFPDPATSTVTYVVYETAGSPCAIIDSVLDYEPHSGRTSTQTADRVISFVHEQDLQVQWLLETHAHADHISAAAYLRKQLGGAIAIGEHIRSVQAVFERLFNLEPAISSTSPAPFDHLFADGETFQVGALTGRVMHVPGHTPADIAYLFDGIAFMGDTLFMPDVGTARCDFPGGDARQLYASMRKLLAFPPQTQLYVCHDYPPEGREAKCLTTVAEQRAGNIHVHDGVDENAFVAMRTTRDAGLGMPTLLLPAIQVNVRAGNLPPAEENGVTYLKIPLNQL